MQEGSSLVVPGLDERRESFSPSFLMRAPGRVGRSHGMPWWRVRPKRRTCTALARTRLDGHRVVQCVGPGVEGFREQGELAAFRCLSFILCFVEFDIAAEALTEEDIDRLECVCCFDVCSGAKCIIIGIKGVSWGGAIQVRFVNEGHNTLP